MNVLVLGGDGFIGWPTALALKSKGHAVTIVDNFRRRVSLAPKMILKDWEPIHVRSQTANIPFVKFSGDRSFGEETDLINSDSLDNIFRTHKPDALIFLAENLLAEGMYQGMIKVQTALTNINRVFSFISTISPKTHLVYVSDYRLFESDVDYGNEILNPSSLHLLLKSQVHSLLDYYARKGSKITEVMPGLLWGAQTSLTIDDLHNAHLVNDKVHQFVYPISINQIVYEILSRRHTFQDEYLVDHKFPYVNLETLVNTLVHLVENEPIAGSGLRCRYAYDERKTTSSWVSEIADLCEVKLKNTLPKDLIEWEPHSIEPLEEGHLPPKLMVPFHTAIHQLVDDTRAALELVSSVN